jgi:hypothetical protein
MTQIEYTVISGTPCVEPYDLGVITRIATGTDPVNTAQIVRIHDEFRPIHMTHVNVEQAIKCIILEALNNMYTSQLEDYILQYAN